MSKSYRPARAAARKEAHKARRLANIAARKERNAENVASKPRATDWSALTVAALREECASRGIKTTSKSKKADLVAALS